MTVCFITMFAWGGKCVAGTLCGSVACLAKMVRHALVTSGELIISQERDVLATALGSLEDKRRMSPVEAVVTGWILWKGEAGNGPVPFAPGASLRSAWFRHQGRGCVRVWACVSVCARAVTVCVEPRPLVNPVTLERSVVEAVKTTMWCQGASLEIVCCEIQPGCFFSVCSTLRLKTCTSTAQTPINFKQVLPCTRNRNKTHLNVYKILVFP